MKIIFKTSTGKNTCQHDVEITTPSDEHRFGEMLDYLRAACIAWGYHPDTVNEAFGEECVKTTELPY